MQLKVEQFPHTWIYDRHWVGLKSTGLELSIRNDQQKESLSNDGGSSMSEVDQFHVLDGSKRWQDWVIFMAIITGTFFLSF